MTWTVPYGCAAVTDTHTAVTLVPGRALRLNGGDWRFGEAPDPTRLADRDGQLGLLREHLIGLCDRWAPNQARFVDAYFAFVIAQVAREAPALATRLAPFGDLYRVEDFRFSALRPLPRAHVRDPDGWIAVDVAFWTGTDLIALDIADSRHTRRRREMDHARLAAAGAQVVSVPAEALVGTTPDLAPHLPPALTRFCGGETLPSSPFKAASLGDIVDADPEP